MLIMAANLGDMSPGGTSAVLPPRVWLSDKAYLQRKKKKTNELNIINKNLKGNNFTTYFS